MDSTPSPSSSPSSSSSSTESESPSSESPSISSPNNSRAKLSHDILLRCSLLLGFFFISILSLSYAFGFFALLFATFSIPPPISVPSQCKIVSSSVDLRSSKICELGLLNYKAKRVFYPSERRKFRCRYDYYWASIFKVEYRDHFSGQIILGLAEAPREALPSDCRPNFATALLTKHILKVNETYDCWYTSGRSKVEIFQDSYFGCQAKDPSLLEMMRRYSILFTKLIQNWLFGQLKSMRMGLFVILGVIVGFLTAIISLIMFTLFSRLLCSFPRAAAAMLGSLIHRMIFSRIFFLVAYLSIVGWLAIQYGKRLGLPELFVDY
ncbi:hypothetical protein BVRB_5g107470 [Beta vulgaris subsp. vulgaris]|nr:hypothetical protein BVRB_5g107470 [Beta vulgaris subsp. vulgaris]